ncbi:MAG: transcriptional regulator GcvA [Alphaproteobacteria bacterium]|nr:transcriptional regulator GcvA [Alphaproteobacteria bacterium]
MSRAQLPLNALRAFEAAARHSSFTQAADELHVTQAAVSHQVKGLEERLGVPLFIRRPRGLEITAEGQGLLPDLRDAFDRMTQALDRVGRKSSAGTLNVSLITTFALAWLVPRLHRFQTKHPDIEVRMTTTQRVVDFAREDFDCAIRFTVQPEADLHAVRLFNDVLTPLCGKRYADRLKSLDDLKKAPLIDMTNEVEWPIWLRAVGLGDYKPKRLLTFDSTMIAVEAAMEGAGVAVGPPQLFREELAQGRLFQPFPQIVDSGKAWWFCCPPSSASRPKIRAFEDWLLEELAASSERGPRPAAVAARR